MTTRFLVATDLRLRPLPALPDEFVVIADDGHRRTIPLGIGGAERLNEAIRRLNDWMDARPGESPPFESVTFWTEELGATPDLLEPLTLIVEAQFQAIQAGRAFDA